MGPVTIAAMMIAAQGNAPAVRQQVDANSLLGAALECRAVTDDAARLRCYDEAVGRLQEANAGGRLVVADRSEVQRSLFGFSIPRMFGGGDDAPREMEGTVKSAREVGYHNWLIELEEGGTWQTTENSSRQDLPRRGQKVKITRGPVGNYWLAVVGRRGFRAKRVG